MRQALILIILIAAVVFGVYWFTGSFESHKDEPIAATSFEECAAQGNPVMESYPRQCTDAAGNHFTEAVPGLNTFSYTNASANDITVELPFPGAVVGKEFAIIGEARGPWFFEASFPVVVTDWDGLVIYETHAEAQPDPGTGEVNWMTNDFVPFRANVTIPESYIGKGTIILKNDNPSGLPERDKAVEFPITIEY